MLGIVLGGAMPPEQRIDEYLHPIEIGNVQIEVVISRMV